MTITALNNDGSERVVGTVTTYVAPRHYNQRSYVAEWFDYASFRRVVVPEFYCPVHTSHQQPRYARHELMAMDLERVGE